MKLSKTLIAGIIAAVVIVAAAGVALMMNNNDNGDTEEVQVRVGYLTGDLHQMSRLVLMNSSAFGGTSLLEKYDVNAVAANPGGYAAGGEIMNQFAAGTIDIAWLGAPPVILNVANSNTSIKVVATANSEGSALIAKAGINSIADLDQKTVATPGPSSIQHLLFLSICEANGFNVTMSGAGTAENTVYWTTIAPVNQKAALQSGQVDAAIGWEPYCSDSLLDGTAQIVNWSSEIWPDHPCCVIAVSNSFAQAHPDIVAKILKADMEANEWIADSLANAGSANYTALLDMAQTFSNRNQTVVLQALDHIKFTYELSDELKTWMVTFTNSYRDLGVITQAKWDERGFSSVESFVDFIVDDQYLAMAANVTA